MNLAEIALSRTISQHIAGTKLKSVKEIVSWMGAMQAQDFSMSKWAIGVRLPGATNTGIEKAIAKADIIRTHVLRPTWHFVSAKDVHWMLDLTAPHLNASMQARRKELELTDKVLAKSNRIIEKALSGGHHLTRDELIALLEKGKLATHDQRAAHMILSAELSKIICSGPVRDNKITYGLLAERVSTVTKLTREEALGTLATKYFTSHGPATVPDFTWWSGLPAADGRKALELVKGNFIQEIVNERTYWFSPSLTLPLVPQDNVHLLPAFDEFIISYKDRSACLPTKHLSKTISANGIFWPVVVINGQVTGLWKRTGKKDKVIVDIQFFPGLKKQNKDITLFVEQSERERRGFFCMNQYLTIGDYYNAQNACPTISRLSCPFAHLARKLLPCALRIFYKAQ